MNDFGPFPSPALLGPHVGHGRCSWPSSGLCPWPIKFLIKESMISDHFRLQRCSGHIWAMGGAPGRVLACVPGLLNCVSLVKIYDFERFPPPVLLGPNLGHGRGSWPSSGLCPWPFKFPFKESMISDHFRLQRCSGHFLAMGGVPGRVLACVFGLLNILLKSR